MKTKVLGVILCVPLLVSAVATGITGTSTAASGTTSVRITRYAADNLTILFQQSIDFPTMQTTFSVKGDGLTHYWLEGPNFDGDPWDPDETGNVKDWGALKGTDLKDLCIWAGEPAGQTDSADTIRVTANDGLTKTLPYDNVYNPPAVQGPAVICWYKDGQTVPSYSDGMRLAFFAQTANSAGNYVYGVHDMQETMPVQYWHFYYQAGIPYPTTTGLSVKYVSAVDICTQVAPPSMEGDVSGNGRVTISDALMIAQYKAGMIALTADQLLCADTTDDGNVTMADAMHIAQWLVDPDGSLGVLRKPLWESPTDDNMLPPVG